MLVLSRKPLESVMVGTSDGGQSVCKVTVLEIRGGRVRLGFAVDSHVPLHRLELSTKIHADQCAALLAAGEDTSPVA
jgi:carbon storage regulator CsrA